MHFCDIILLVTARYIPVGQALHSPDKHDDSDDDVAEWSDRRRRLDKKTLWRRSVGLLIMRAQRPLRLIGGPFYVISYETLLAVRNGVVWIMTTCSLVGGYQHVTLLESEPLVPA